MVVSFLVVFVIRLKSGTFNFVDNTLTALFVFDYFNKKKLNPVMLWDLAENGCYVISTKQNWKNYIKRDTK